MKAFGIINQEDFHASLLNFLPKIASALSSIMGDGGKTLILRKNGRMKFSKSPIDLLEGLNFENSSDQSIAAILLNAIKKMDYSSKAGTIYAFLTCELVLRGLKYITAGVNRESFLDGLESFYMEIDQTLGAYSQKVEGIDDLNKLASYHLKSEKVSISKLFESGLGFNPSFFIDVKQSDSVETLVNRIEGFYIKADEIQAIPSKKIRKTLTLTGVAFCIDKVTLQKALSASLKNKSAKIIFVLKSTIDEDILISMSTKAPNDIYLYTMDDIKEVEEFMAYVGLEMSSIGDISESVVESVEIKDGGLVFYQKPTSQRIEFINQLRKSQKESESLPEWNKIQKRIAIMDGTFSEILVGAPTKTAVENETGLIKEAIDELQMITHYGMVTGGGAALYYAARFTDWEKTNNEAFSAGGKILFEALEMLELVQIGNSTTNPEFFLKMLQGSNDARMLYSHRDKKLVNASDSMMFDSLVLIRQSLKQAVSTATQIMNSELLITRKK